MTTTETLIVVVAAIVIVGLLWYYRARIPFLRGNVDPDVAREHKAGAAAAEEARVEAMVRRYCPHCGEDRDFRAGTCVECGYRLG